jgi:hypothetical protein
MVTPRGGGGGGVAARSRAPAIWGAGSTANSGRGRGDPRLLGPDGSPRHRKGRPAGSPRQGDRPRARAGRRRLHRALDPPCGTACRPPGPDRVPGGGEPESAEGRLGRTWAAGREAMGRRQKCLHFARYCEEPTRGFEPRTPSLRVKSETVLRACKWADSDVAGSCWGPLWGPLPPATGAHRSPRSAWFGRIRSPLTPGGSKREH